MHIISLLTDFGNKDNFAGVMKAAILKINPQAKIVDLSHNVSPQNIFEAAFLLKGSFKYFPKDTVHLVVVDPGVGSKRRKLLVKTKDYYFVAPDNGVLSLALKGEDTKEIIEITNDRYFLKPVSDTFHGRDIFAPVAAYLSLGRRIEDFGKKIKTIKHLSFSHPKRLKNKLIGEIIYVDHFGNLITNITKADFVDFIKDSGFEIRIANYSINKINRSYEEAKKDSPQAIFNSFANLEIFLTEASAKERLILDKGTLIEVALKHG